MGLIGGGFFNMLGGAYNAPAGYQRRLMASDPPRDDPSLNPGVSALNLASQRASPVSLARVHTLYPASTDEGFVQLKESSKSRCSQFFLALISFNNGVDHLLQD